MSNAWRRRALLSTAAVVAQVTIAVAHTVSIGYENAGPGAVTFWYGTYHNTGFTEGSLQLVGPGANTTVGFTLLTTTKPGGLVDGTNNFYSNGSALVGSFAASAYVFAGPVVTWQGVTFVSLSPGNYTFTYIPISSPSADWAPIDSVILSSTVTLTAADIGSIPLLPFALNSNQISVAKAIDAALSGGLTNSAFSDLSSLSPAAIINALTQLSGEIATGQIQSNFYLLNQFINLLLDAYINNRGGPGGGFGPTLAFAPEKRMSREMADARAAVTPADALPQERHWSIWGSAFGGRGELDGNLAGTGSSEATLRGHGFAVGLDYRLWANTVVGFALAGGRTSWGLANTLGSGSSDVFQAGVYASTTFGPAYLSAALAYAWHDMSTERTLLLAGVDRLRGTFTTRGIGGRLEGGYRFATPWVGVTPYAALQVQSFHNPSYSEAVLFGTGAFALSYGSHTVTDTRSELGVWLDKRFMQADGTSYALRLRGAWVHNFSPDQYLGASFLSLPGATFDVVGAAAPANAVLTSLGAEMNFVNGVTLGAKVDAEFSSRSEAYAATGTVRYVW